METAKGALLYRPDGKEVSSSDYPKKDISSLDMQPYTDNTKFDIGDLVEIRFREIDGNPRTCGCDTRLGYVIEDNKYGTSIVLSMCIPKKWQKRSIMVKNRISEFRVFLPTKDDCFTGYDLLEHIMIGSMVELFEKVKTPLKAMKYSGYITKISTGIIKISMDHPSNRYTYKSINTKKFGKFEIDKFRVIGYRKLW